MYEELVKRLREAPNDWPDAGLHYEAADAIEELSASVAGYEAATDVEFVKEDGHERIRFVPKWIPVTERLEICGMMRKLLDINRVVKEET